ncbi:MAG: hypothetical protein JNJ57_06565, partial [Saprospiraceae bacterium]|nr:hypothetical protein [Saprospiraceae bacterium]
MKKLLLAFFFICSFFKQNFAQTTFAPVGAEWYYRYIHFWADIDSYARATCVADTIVSGKSCKKICLKRNLYDVPTYPECDETLFFHQS